MGDDAAAPADTLDAAAGNPTQAEQDEAGFEGSLAAQPLQAAPITDPPPTAPSPEPPAAPPPATADLIGQPARSAPQPEPEAEPADQPGPSAPADAPQAPPQSSDSHALHALGPEALEAAPRVPGSDIVAPPPTDTDMTEPAAPAEPLPSEAPQKRGLSPTSPGAAAAEALGLTDPEGGDGTLADAGPMELVCHTHHLSVGLYGGSACQLSRWMLLLLDLEVAHGICHAIGMNVNHRLACRHCCWQAPVCPAPKGGSSLSGCMVPEHVRVLEDHSPELHLACALLHLLAFSSTLSICSTPETTQVLRGWPGGACSGVRAGRGGSGL